MGTIPVHVERLQASLDDSDLATEQTIERMTAHIRQCANDPVVIAAARKAVGTYGAGQPGRRSAAWAAWWSIKHASRLSKTISSCGASLPTRPSWSCWYRHP